MEPSMDTVLYLCTGNLCRSPVGAASTAAALRDRTDEVVVTSAGTQGIGAPSPDLLVAVAGEQAIDLRGHRGRRLDPSHLDAATLVIGMAREHVRDAVLAQPAIWPRCFTLRELVRRGHDRGGRRPDETLPAWLARVHEGRRHADLLGASPDDDVADPMGGPAGEYRAMVVEVTALTGQLVRLAWPASPPRT